MQISLSSDYAIRSLVFIGLHQQQRVQVKDIAQAYSISVQHLVKIVHQLGIYGFLETRQGRGGGIRLARSPSDINIGEVIQMMEPHWILIECFEARTNSCRIASACLLREILHRALAAFFRELRQHTLADLLGQEAMLRQLLALPLPEVDPV